MSRSDIQTHCPALEFTDVSAVRGGREIWSHAAFEVPAGGIVAVIGANGSGKTTLLQMILGLMPVATGRLRVFGKQPGVDDRIGYVPQDYAGSVGEAIRAIDSVMLGLTGHRWTLRRSAAHDRRQVRECLKAVDAESFAHHRLSTLSGGQRQRVAIAEALVASPHMLILDEPLASLDARSQAEMVRLLARLHREFGGTILVVAHDLNPLLPILDSAIYLLEKRVRYARIAEVVDGGLLTRLYDTPMQVLRTPDGGLFIRSAL